MWVTEAVLTSTHNICLREKIRKNVNSYKPQFYYIKVGCKGFFVTRTCFRDVCRKNCRQKVGSEKILIQVNFSYYINFSILFLHKSISRVLI